MEIVKSIRKFIKKTDEILGKCESLLLTLFLSVIIIFSSAQIVFRAFFHTSIIWIDPFLRSLMLWLAFIAGAKAVQLNLSIKIDILDKIAGKKQNVKIQNLISSISCLICAYLFIISCIFIKTEKEFDEVFINMIKTWHIELIFPIGFFLMSFHFFHRILKKD